VEAGAVVAEAVAAGAEIAAAVVTVVAAGIAATAGKSLALESYAPYFTQY
jgi:hypothetical protein